MDTRSLRQIYEDLNLKREFIYNDVAKRKSEGGDFLIHNYDEIYGEYLKDFRYKKGIKLAQIGILMGHSIRLYNEYFKDVSLYCYDINIDIFLKRNENTDLMKNVKELKVINSLNGSETEDIKESFDIIIDDGDHNPKSMFKTFKNFYSKLNKGGLYFIEDVTTQRLKVIELFLNKAKVDFIYIKIAKNKNNHGIIIIKKY